MIKKVIHKLKCGKGFIKTNKEAILAELVAFLTQSYSGSNFTKSQINDNTKPKIDFSCSHYTSRILKCLKSGVGKLFVRRATFEKNVAAEGRTLSLQNRKVYSLCKKTHIHIKHSFFIAHSGALGRHAPRLRTLHPVMVSMSGGGGGAGAKTFLNFDSLGPSLFMLLDSVHLNNFDLFFLVFDIFLECIYS